MRRFKLEEKEFSEINITPFTDVILVVLIIFMITSPILISGALKVKLPQASSTENTLNNNIQVYMDDKNEIFLNSKHITLYELPEQLRNEYIQENTTEVIVNADKNAVYGNVVQLLDVIKNSGATKLLMGTLKK
jgi:biopolymer transport protein ExbD